MRSSWCWLLLCRFSGLIEGLRFPSFNVCDGSFNFSPLIVLAVFGLIMTMGAFTAYSLLRSWFPEDKDKVDEPLAPVLPTKS